MPESASADYEELARAALLEITPAATIGSLVGQTPEDNGSITVRFVSTQPGYPDWFWTVSVADVEGGEPTVLEAELLPGEGALLAPDWVPWSERLAEYKAAQEALGATEVDDDEADADATDDEESEEDDLDDHVMDDDDMLGSDVLHGGDLDGVDIDEPEDESDDDLDDDDEDDDDLDDGLDLDDDEDERSY